MDRIKKLLFEDKQDWIGPKVWAYLMGNPTFLVTSLYLCISSLGLLYEYALFDEFEINILDYSEAADFFLAAFKRPQAFLNSIMIVSTLVVYRIVANFARKQRSTIIRVLLLSFSFVGLFRREILVPIGVVYFLLFYIIAAEREAQRLVLQPETTATISYRFGASKKATVVPIGTTERFIFGVQYSDELNRSQDDKAKITPLIVAIPFTNIARIEYQNLTFERQEWRRLLSNNGIQAMQ